ncbi:MAG: aminodeoxychorismate/anthranilate synthase component II [Prevotellaceae bacterium]|jgi:anthranilate synthase component 2|nr:aminodeoxychorismate/anthranilate synthase component II [Prevotellaceae bacterium]
MKILVFDNYDSFTYNLVHSISRLGYDVDVARNDCIALEDVDKYDKIVLSPGPGIPSESGILLDLIKTYAPTKSIFGVCLGEQAIGEVFGGQLENLANVYHGVSTEIQVVDDDILFAGLERRFEAGRYHSWIVSRENFPDDLKITAIDAENNIMALAHRRYDVRGVQFHPESVLTPVGMKILKNWLESINR